MTTWIGPVEDYTKLQEGDVILGKEFRDPCYVEEIRVRETHRENVIRPEVRVSLYSYAHSFESIKTPGAGYSFDCFEDGTVPDRDISDWNKPYKTYADYIAFVANDPDHVYVGIEVYFNYFVEPAVIRCEGRIKVRRGNQLRARYVDCNTEIPLDMVMTNTCPKCHTDYNGSGQRLAPREQWGWDTGESLSDILSSDFGINEREEDRAMERTFDY